LFLFCFFQIVFDCQSISMSSEVETASIATKQRGRPRKSVSGDSAAESPAPKAPASSRKSTSRKQQQQPLSDSAGGGVLDAAQIAESDQNDLAGLNQGLALSIASAAAVAAAAVFGSPSGVISFFLLSPILIEW
jgi:hypothetical protein